MANAKRYDGRMEFRILGPLEVADGSRSVPLDAPKQRALLGLLLLHPKEVVSSERVIDELWGERAPATAGKVVQTYVSQLRRALGAEAIVTCPPGYLLQVEEEAVDASRFRHLAAEARLLAADDEQQERADVLYRQALALWRGPPLAGVAFESFARNEVERLEQERLDALIGRIDCELALGQHEQLVPELETLVRQYPLRERLRGQLMLALYRSGRQADALAAYKDARRTLVDELGLEPSRELQDLEKAILNHDASLELAARVEPAPPDHAADGTDGRAFAPAWLRRRPVLAFAALLLLAAAIGLAFILRPDQAGSISVVPNSVGFVDARSGRMTKAFPVGRGPHSIAVLDSSVWVANYQDETVTRIDRASGEPITIAVGGHPTGLTAHQGDVWVWTLEGRLIQIDPRFSVSVPVELGARIARLMAPVRGVAPMLVERRMASGRITSGGGFLWVTVPLTTVVRIDPAEPLRARVIVPADGVGGAIAYREGAAWIAGYDDVFPIEASTGIAEPGAVVGSARSLAFGDGSLWVVSGGRDQGVVWAVRRVDVHARVVETTITVSDAVAVASAAGSIWVASRGDGAIRRIQPTDNRVRQTIRLGAHPSALAADADGVWVAVE
jgi:DNA-binding SARP family transcriptional activator